MSEDLLRALPRARRYARALVGSQEAGDALVREALLALRRAPPEQGGEQGGTAALLALYRAVSARVPESPPLPGGGLTPLERQVLLLTSLEGLNPEAAAAVLGRDAGEVAAIAAAARERLREGAQAEVLIVEDEPIIAMDLGQLVAACGHRVAGIAATQSEAVALARSLNPTLILADINLGKGGDGKAAVAEILREMSVPVIFVTAYPERLLTGEALEPAFVVTKPFDPMTLAIATYQAVTGGLRLG
ncbi:response regulator [Elioraea sp. Yellowstone]|jgi:CheY-like chemotaxis protein|uniref:PhyR family response regulator anti-anti-sigma factor n=1 Tax=Elioraea sp. Yellowstone TaxID=2592070 RepID=UPI00114F17DC|nr:response regulator [Elioraea sp. Yellowstone]TQF82231.1 response regulator [Elioraea sp. Yellowstone]